MSDPTTPAHLAGAERPRRAAGPVVAWGSLSAGYVVEAPGGVTFTRSPIIAMRLAEVTR